MQRNIACTSTDISSLGSTWKERQESWSKVCISLFDLAFLVKNKKWKDVDNKKYEYTGEVDQDGKLCGYGTAFQIDQADSTEIKGTWFND